MTRLKFDISQKKELNNIKYLLKEKDWFEREDFPIFWPKNIHAPQKEMTEVSTRLTASMQKLRSDWRAIENQYFKTVSKFKHKRLSRQYLCHVSYFGPEGSYHSPNSLIIRLHTATDRRRAVESIGHELIHLMFINYFNSQSCDYAEREWLVDHLILRSDLINFFPGYQAQSVGKPRLDILKKIL
jgi:hypothetical protein